MTYNELFNSLNVLIEHPIFEYLKPILYIVLISIIAWKWNIVIFLKNRIWSVLLGKRYSDFLTDSWNNFHKDNIEIAHFNVLYRVSANTIEQINKYQRWIYRNGVSAVQISKIKGRFNIEKLTFLKPNKVDLFGFGTILLICISAGLFSFNFVMKPAALLKIGKEEPWFWVAKDYAHNSQISWIPFTNSKWLLTSSVCESSDFNMEEWSNNTNMSITTGEMICEYFSNEKSKEAVSKIISDQRAFFLPITGLLFLFIIGCCYSLFKIAKTQDLRLQIKRHRMKKWKNNKNF